VVINPATGRMRVVIFVNMSKKACYISDLSNT
jgi:hypothetical protein